MTASFPKQLVIFCILLATLSQSIYVAEAREKKINRKLQLKEMRSSPRYGSYIKTSKGKREARATSIDVVTITAPDGGTRKLTTGEVRCRLWQSCMLYQDDQGDSHQWECSFEDQGVADEIGGFESKVVVVENVLDTNDFLEINGAESGQSILVMSSALIETDRIVVDFEEVVGIEAYNPNDDDRTGGAEAPRLKGAKPLKTGRRLADTKGTMNTLVVRVKAQDNEPTADPQQLYEDIFGDEYCLKSQYNRCSYGQLDIQEYIPGVISDVPTAVNAPGVVEIDVAINAEGATTAEVQNLANLALETLFGQSAGNLFDLVLFCMPPGMGNWLAYAYIDRWDSYYNNDWCQAMSSQMHEVGHSIGLHHSGEYSGSDAAIEYGDQSDLMGFSYRQDDTPVMCFNAAKNWQLGWYDDKQIDVNPNSDLSQEPTSFVLNGIVDYGDSTIGANIVVKVGDYYIGYNKATSFNIGTQEGGDQVLVNEKLGNPTSFTKSKLAARMSILGEFVFELTPMLSVKVKYVSNTNEKDAIIELSIVGEPQVCQGEFDAEIEVLLTTDNYPAETSWGIADSSGQFVFFKDGISTIGSSTTPVGGLCRGLEYYFIINDSYGDGICCSWGNGEFSGNFGDLSLFSGNSFEDQLIKPFTLPLADTLPPTKAPTNVPTTKPPTNAPTTKPPTNPPTNAPTTKPPTNAPTTKAPTNPPTTKPQTPGPLTGCVDDASYVYRNKAGKDCGWVKHDNDRKTKIVCLRRANNPKSDKRKVWQYCQSTCSAAGVNKACPAS